MFGADVDEAALFNETRLRTAQVDQLVYPSIEALYRTFGREPFDIIIDDGLHSAGANLNMLRFALSGALKPANPHPHPHPQPNPQPNPDQAR